MTQVTEGLPSMLEAWVWSPAPHKPGVVVHSCNPSPLEVKAGGSRDQDHSLQHGDIKTVGYVRPGSQNPSLGHSGWIP